MFGGGMENKGQCKGSKEQIIGDESCREIALK